MLGGLLAVVLLLIGLVAGYLLLAYNRSVGAPPIADPVPEQCTLSASVLARAGTTSWQGGPLFAGGKGRSGVNCRWVAAEDESIRMRRLTVQIVDYESAAAAKKRLKSRAKGLQAEPLEGDAADAVVVSADGAATLVARAGEMVFEIEYVGSDKRFFSAITDDEVAVPAAEAQAAAQAVVDELVAKLT